MHCLTNTTILLILGVCFVLGSFSLLIGCANVVRAHKQWRERLAEAEAKRLRFLMPVSQVVAEVGGVDAVEELVVPSSDGGEKDSGGAGE